MSRKILGLDLGSNSIGWALLEEVNGQAVGIIDLGCRIFNKAVEEKSPVPKNQDRRQKRLGRRVIQRRARRKQRMLNYLVSLSLLPKKLQGNHEPEYILNKLGDPYELRARALDQQLLPYQLGRILLHFSARRGFLSTKKQAAGDLVDDPDTISYLRELDKMDGNESDKKSDKTSEEGAFKADIKQVYQKIENADSRTLGEYLYKLEKGMCKRNRAHEGGHLRTDRAMYQYELEQIWKKQKPHFPHLPDDFMTDGKGVKEIIFYQRPLKLKKDRVGKCSLEPKNNRANTARLEVQKYRYLLDVNNLRYFDRHEEKYFPLNEQQRADLIDSLEHTSKMTVSAIKKKLRLDKFTKIKLEEKNIKGNITACEIRSVLGEQWDEMDDPTRHLLFEDLFTIKKKSALKMRLINRWDLDVQTAVRLCLLEFEPGHSNHSLKAIKRLLPHLEEGMLYSDARKEAGYGYEEKESDSREKLEAPPETANPIVNKGLHELRRVINAIIKQHGKPDAIRIEMARDLEMNTQRYKKNLAKQRANQKKNEEAQAKFEKLSLGKKYASRDDKIKYRLWIDQDKRCAYSNTSIPVTQVFSASTEIDHILPFKKSLDDSYMNKVICLTAENRDKGDRTPRDAWGMETEKWNQITQAISKWDKSLKSKVARFFQIDSDLQKRDFIENQLNDTRYISRLAQGYVQQLGCDVSVTKGIVVSKIRHQWGFDSLIGETSQKERNDHRHHAIDAVVIAATSRSLYTKSIRQIERNKLNIVPPYPNIRNDLEEKLKHIIVSHVPQYKLSGSLHEDTGAGYIAKHGGFVYRKELTPKFTIKNANSIVDETVKERVLAHLESYEQDPKKAFSSEELKKLKIGKTPIKRVRVLQSELRLKKSENAEDKLHQIKFGVKDKQGKIFKWMVYGNTHHVEIIRNKETGKITGEFVTMMEAHRRAMAKTKSAKRRGVVREEIVKTDHGKEHEFLMALHINDTVSIDREFGERAFYRVQNIDSEGNRFALQLGTIAKQKSKEEELRVSINKKSFDKYKIKLHRINAIGRLVK